MNSLTAKHYSILRVAKSQLGLTDEDYRATLLRFAGSESAKALNAQSFQKLMAHFEQMGFQSTAKRKDAVRRPGMASQAQLRKIAALWADFTDETGTETSLRHWMEKHSHGHGTKWLDAAGAQKVIGALTKMIERKISQPH
ncbi:regulatory protein GemA [Pararhizobium gei]|uniref:regulatory protein GemA n=1 Tax=Pararhizobium gei TaxID=1395951 RepID=UPI0023DA728B|nr:regulatory protein GemA [Rhizobium gei]